MSEEFIKFLDMQQRSATTGSNQVPDLVVDGTGARHRTFTDRKEDFLQKKFKSSDGTPISTNESPLSFLERGRMATRRTPEDKQSFLEHTLNYGEGNVRLVGDTPVVRTVDENGNPRDIVVDEDSVTWDDLADIAGALPDVAGALAVLIPRARMGKPLPKGWLGRVGGVLKESAYAALGGQSAGGIADISTRLRDMPNTINSSISEKIDAVNPEEIVLERLKLGMIDTATGSAGELAGFAVMRGANLMRNLPGAGGKNKAI